MHKRRHVYSVPGRSISKNGEAIASFLIKSGSSKGSSSDE